MQLIICSLVCPILRPLFCQDVSLLFPPVSVKIVQQGQFLRGVGVLVHFYHQSLAVVRVIRASDELALDCFVHVGDLYIQIFGAIIAAFRLNREVAQCGFSLDSSKIALKGFAGTLHNVVVTSLPLLVDASCLDGSK